MIGYYVYRSTDSHVSNAQRISNIISANNQPETHNYSFTDSETEYETTYYYWLQSCDLDGSNQYHGSICVTTGNGQTIQNPLIPITTKLKNAYPNPFNPSTSISFDIADPSDVKIEIFNTKGQKVRDLLSGYCNVGSHSIVWNGKDNNGIHCGTGIYFYKMQAGKFVQVNKMMMMK